MGSDLVRRLIRMVRQSPRADLEGLVRWLVSRRATRACLNVAYNRFSPARKETFYALFAKIFRDHPQRIAAGQWWVDVGGRWAVLPLDGHETWLEWDLAVSLLGHEVEVKRTYLDLIRLRRPKLFFDIGANYGLHSMLFLLHGVPTVSFEPNPRCYPYFRKLAERNNVVGDLQQVALGATEGSVEISFPERETWLGSTNSAVVEQVVEMHGEQVTRVRVEQTTLDRFLQRDGRRPDLIKVDTEGNEAVILEGARKTLTTCRPWVIFESWRDAERDSLLTFFEDLDYRICALPLQLRRPPLVLERARLLDWPTTNLIALPLHDVESGFRFCE
jgi:FkbM family methyltransferase